MSHLSIRKPSVWLLAMEGRAFWELVSLIPATPWLRRAPRGDGHPVMVLPGFLASDLSTRPLRAFLHRRGYTAYGWDRGFNLGQPGDPAHDSTEDPLDVEHMESLVAEHGARVSLVGWSLGGIYARELARKRPDLVRQVITLGSPFNGNPNATYLSRIYELVKGVRLDDLHEGFLEMLRTPPPVPCTAIFSTSDGVVAWRNCVQLTGALSENVRVFSSHLGLGLNPAVLWIVAERLAQAEGRWKPLARTGLPSFVARVGVA